MEAAGGRCWDTPPWSKAHRRTIQGAFMGYQGDAPPVTWSCSGARAGAGHWLIKWPK